MFLEGEEVQDVVKKVESYFNVGQAFAHYTGDEKENVKTKFDRVHECFCYEKDIKYRLFRGQSFQREKIA